MQASKFILIRLLSCCASIVFAFLVGCGEKTPEQIEAENQKNTDIAIRRARVLMFEDKSASAIKLLEETYQKCGSSAELCESLAYAYAQNGQLASAAMFFENASNQKEGDSELQINAAKAYEQSNAFDSAVKAYEKYLKMKPSDVVAWKSLSACLEKLEKYRESLNAYMSALKAAGRNPNTTEATKIGSLFVKVGNVVQARQWLEASYKSTLPTNLETRKAILLDLISVYLAQKESALLEETVAILDKIDANVVDTKYPELRAQLKAFRKNLEAAKQASILAKQKELEAKDKAEEQAKLKAEEDAKKAAEQKKKEVAEESPTQNVVKKGDEPTDKKVEKNLEQNTDEQDNTTLPAQESEPLSEGEAKIKESNIEDATISKKEPTDYNSLVQKCYDFIAQNDALKAEKLAHAAIALDSQQETAWRALAKAYEISNKNNDSYMAAYEAYKRNPDSIDATLFYLRNASRVLNNEKFLDKVYRAYEKFPNNPEIWVDLARTYNLIGDKRNSTFFYKQFLTHTPKEHPLYDEMSKEYQVLSEQ